MTAHGGALRADIFRETRWQRHEMAGSASFSDEQEARAWISAELERLRVVGQYLGGDEVVRYVGELRKPAGEVVCNAYLFDGALPVDWDEGEKEGTPRATPSQLQAAQRRRPSAAPLWSEATRTTRREAGR